MKPFKVINIPTNGHGNSSFRYAAIEEQLRKLPKGKAIVIPVPGNLSYFRSNLSTIMNRYSLKVHSKKLSKDGKTIAVWIEPKQSQTK